MIDPYQTTKLLKKSPFLGLLSMNPFPVNITKRSLLLILFVSLASFESFSQIDVTNTFLTNAGFNNDSNYPTGGTESISSTSPPNATNITGWSLEAATSWGAAATFEYGWNGDFNGVSIPATGPDGATGTAQGALGISSGWSGDIIYSQKVTLPAGLYSIEVASRFEGANSIGSNLTGWVGNDGNIVLSDLTSATVGTWNTTTISFRLISETIGDIQVGVRAANSGTGSNAKVFTDYIKLISHTADKANLQALVDTANEMLADPQSVPEGSTAYADLQTTVDNAQAILNDESATTEEILTAEDDMQAAIDDVNKAIFEDNLTVYDNHTATYATLTDENMRLTGKGQITLTSPTNAMDNSAIDLASPNAWVYFPNTLPSEVVNSYLSNFTVNAQQAELGTNIRVTNYLNGAMVIGHSNNYAALTVFDGPNQSGDSMDLMINQHYKTAELGAMADDIESFILKRGYMATFAVNENGTGGSRVYIADDADVFIDMMPKDLSNSASMVVVRQWRWTTKKGWRGNASGADRFNAGSFYDYNNTNYGTLDREYVPMRHNPNWNSYGNFMDKFNSTHALGYNEPDNSVDDGFSSVDDAIAAWPAMMESGLRLGAPGTTDGGLNWTYEFMDRIDALGYRVDFVPWHFYRANTTPQQLYDQLLAIHNRTGRPIWITEFNNGCNWTYNGNAPSTEKNAEVIKGFIEMLEKAPFVERYYVWDGCNETLRMTNSGSGQLYPAGVVYRDLVSSMAYSDDFYNSVAIKKIQENEAGFCSLDGTINTTYPHTGVGYANVNKSVGSGIDYKINFISGGTKTLSVRYASTMEHSANILLNNSIVASNVIFPSTGGLDRYSNISFNFDSEAGESELRIEATTAEGLGNVDYIEITGGYPTSCEPNPTYPLILSVTSEENTINNADNILDGDDSDNSRWSAQGFPQTVIIDYGKNIPITGTRVSTYQNRAYQYTVELADNLYFTDAHVVDRSTNTNVSQPISDNFEEISARYVRLTVTGASQPSITWVGITEFSIFPEPTAGVDELPHDNFTVGVAHATCTGSSNGSITVSATDQSYTYNVAITGQANFMLSNENGYVREITGLSEGEYTICFTIEGEEGYQQCYTVNIKEPAPLTAVAMVNRQSKSVNISMSGSNLYTIDLNGKQFVTNESNLDLELRPGTNSLEISSNLSCQGTYFEEIFVSEEVLAYPNPTQHWVQIYVGGADNLVQVRLSDIRGHQYFVRELEVPSSRVIEINLSEFSTGVYFIDVQSETVKSNLKILKH